MVYRNEVSKNKIEFTTLRNESCFASLDACYLRGNRGNRLKTRERKVVDRVEPQSYVKITRDRYRAAHRCYLYDLLPVISMRLMYEPRTLRV